MRYTDKTITVGPSYVVENGGTAVIIAGQEITLSPGFEARTGSEVTFKAALDVAAPEVTLSSHSNGQIVTPDSAGLVVFTLNIGDDTVIASIRLLDVMGNDITHLATIAGNVIILSRGTAINGEYSFFVEITDIAGNVTKRMVYVTEDPSLDPTRCQCTPG